MDRDTYFNAVNKNQLQVEESDNLDRVDFTEIVPRTRDGAGFITAECVSEAWSAEVSKVDLADLKQEPGDVCCILYPTYSVHNTTQECLFPDPVAPVAVSKDRQAVELFSC